MIRITAACIAGALVLPVLTADLVGQNEKLYVRVTRDQAGTPTALQTAVVRFVPASGEGDLVVDLVGAVHYGDRAYYEELNKLFKQYDAVLYELVAPEGSRVPSREDLGSQGSPIKLFQKMSQSALGLDSQLACVDYTPKNFVHADLSPQQMMKAIEKRGENGLTLLLGITADLMRQYNLDQKQVVTRSRDSRALETVDPFDELFKPGGANRLKQVLAVQLAQQSTTDGGMGRTIGTILIDDRNRAAMRVFQKQLTKGKKRIAIFYGAAHLADFAKRLRVDFEMKPKRTEWKTAWNLTKRTGSVFSGLLKVLSDELSRDLRGAASRPVKPRRPAPKPVEVKEKKKQQKPRRVIR